MTLIKAAKALGVRSVVIDPDPEAPGNAFADHFEVVGPLDYNLTKKIALKYNVYGIVTSQMENPLRIMAKLAKELNLIFPLPEVIERCRNKYLMKLAFLRHDIPCAKGILINKKEKITIRLLEDLSFPLIMKPADAHSSKGVYRVTDFEDLLKYESESRNFSSDHSVIIEEFIEGPEYSIEAIIHKGKTTIIQHTEKIITPYPRTVELGHIQPAGLSLKQKIEIDTLVAKAIKTLGIDNSATHTELKISKYGPVIIEIGARLGGDYISSYLTNSSTGVNMDKAAIQVAMGLEPDTDIKEKAYSYIRYIELPQGKKVKQIDDWQEFLKNENVVHANVSIKIGDIVPIISDSAKRPGFVIVKGKSKEDVIQKSELYCQQFVKYINLN